MLKHEVIIEAEEKFHVTGEQVTFILTHCRDKIESESQCYQCVY